MKSKLPALLALAFSAALVRAEEPKSSYTLTADFAYVSEYIFRGIEQQDGALQPAVTFTKDTFSLGVWSSQALSNRSANWAQGNEVDLWFSYGIPFDRATISVGGTGYLYTTARPSFGEPDDTWELSLGASGPLGPLTGSATYFHDFVLKADTFEFKLAYSLPLPDDRGVVDFTGLYALNDIGDVNGSHAGEHTIDYKYFGASVAFTYKLNARTALKASVNYVDVGDVPGAPGANLWFSLGLTAGL